MLLKMLQLILEPRTGAAWATKEAKVYRYCKTELNKECKWKCSNSKLSIWTFVKIYLRILESKNTKIMRTKRQINMVKFTKCKMININSIIRKWVMSYILIILTKINKSLKSAMIVCSTNSRGDQEIICSIWMTILKMKENVVSHRKAWINKPCISQFKVIIITLLRTKPML